MKFRLRKRIPKPPEIPRKGNFCGEYEYDVPETSKENEVEGLVKFKTQSHTIRVISYQLMENSEFGNLHYIISSVRNILNHSSDGQINSEQTDSNVDQ